MYGALLVGVLVATRDRVEDRISVPELVPLGAATFALSKVIARERIGAWVREPFVDDALQPHRPRGHRVRRALGELVLCTRCVGAWSALGLVGLRLASPLACGVFRLGAALLEHGITELPDGKRRHRRTIAPTVSVSLP